MQGFVFLKGAEKLGQANLQNWDEVERQIWGDLDDKSENEFDFHIDPSTFGQSDDQEQKKGLDFSAYVKKVELAQVQVKRLKREDHLLTQKRRKQAFKVISSIIIFVGMFYFALGEYSNVGALNNKNSEMKRNISKLQQQTSQAKELLLNSVDEKQVRWFAIENFDMQDPSRGQIINAKMPESDQLIQRGTDANGEYVLSTKNINWAKENLAAYFASAS